MPDNDPKSDENENPNNDGRVVCGFSQISLETLHEKLDGLVDKSEKHFAKGEVAMKQIASLYTSVRDMHQDTKHLGTLPAIRDEMRNLNGKAFDAAMGKRQIPIDVFVIVLMVFTLRDLITFFHTAGASESLQNIVIGTVCLLCVILILGRGSFRAGTAGVEYKKDQ